MTRHERDSPLFAHLKNALLAVLAGAALLYYAGFVHSERAQQKYLRDHQCAVVGKAAEQLVYQCQLPRPSEVLTGADLERLALQAERERGSPKKRSVAQEAATDQ